MNVTLKESSLEKFFNPSSVVIIGASNAPFNLGATICKCLKEYISYRGTVYAINRAGEAVCGCDGFTSVHDLTEPVELAVIITPARVVPQFVRDCGAKGIQHIVIESSGFSEQGDEGKRLQSEIDEAARQYGMRILGPNCLGVLDIQSRFCCFYGAYPEIVEVFDKPGGVSYIIQSGGVGVLLLESLMTDVQGPHKMVSIGNKSDVDEADLIEYFNRDGTQVIAIYLEHVGNGEKLMSMARRVSKPILVFKSGRTAEGTAAALSHTAGMASNDAVFESACRQAGIIRLRSVGELHSMPKMLTEMPLLRGNRIAVFTNSGAFGSISADLMVEAGLALPRLGAASRELLAKIGGVFNINNPVDIGPAPPQTYLDIFEILLSDKEIDGLLLMSSIWREFIIDVMKELVEMCKRYDKPAAIYTPNSVARILSVRKEFGLPLFDTAEEAVRALAVSHEQFRYHRKKENPYARNHQESA
ncbi:MAG: CoA-binding protein [Spirochaetes bacterium]|nr:CoA-binding protein [Spirochaetota bacterium]